MCPWNHKDKVQWNGNLCRVLALARCFGGAVADDVILLIQMHTG